jgi:hypothetical protein
VFIEHATYERQKPEPETNLWAGVEYYTSADLYQAHYTSGKGTWHIGFYPSLNAAVTARKDWIERRRNQERESYRVIQPSTTESETEYATQAS